MVVSITAAVFYLNEIVIKLGADHCFDQYRKILIVDGTVSQLHALADVRLIDNKYLTGEK